MSVEVLGISGSPIKNSNTDRLVGTILDAIGYTRVEDQKEIWEEAKRIGRLIGERLKSK